MKRDLLTIKDLSIDEVKYILDLTKKLKKNPSKAPQILKGKTVGLVFQKPSNRTRVSFEVGVYELGGNCIYLGPEEINLGVRETTADAAQTLSRYLDGIVARTFSHKDILDLAKYSTVPVINGLSDLYHPCQGLTDVFSVIEHFGKAKGLTVAYVGDGNNVCHSLIYACAKVGMHINVATPKGYEPLPEVLRAAHEIAKKTGSQISLTHAPKEAVKGAQVLYSDVWVSMGQETETKKRLKTFEGFQFNRELCRLADKDYIFMHCLPAHRDLEVTAEIIDGPHSIIFDQAENRLHTQKAILCFLYKKERK